MSTLNVMMKGVLVSPLIYIATGSICADLTLQEMSTLLFLLSKYGNTKLIDSVSVVSVSVVPASVHELVCKTLISNLDH
jgi:hypothetical protein